MVLPQMLVSGLLGLAALTSAVPVSTTAPQHSYIVVGGGPSGFVVAEYLTRDPSAYVIMLDAGTDEDTNINITSKS